MRNVSLHAVSIGGLADVAGTFLSVLAVTVVTVALGISSALGSSGPIESSGGLAAVGGGILIPTFVLGTLWSIIGGYIAAFVAKRDEALHGALSSYFCVALGIYGLFAGHGSIPLWMHVFGFTASPALGALGGLLRARQTSRAQADG
jgi:hypothetical protein